MSNNINLQTLIHQSKYEVNYQLDNFKIETISNIIDIINDSDIVYITGVGKSESIAKHICDLFKCIGIKCFYLNILNSLHGDIGTVTSKDSILFLSKSGNTIELNDKIQYFKLKKCKIVSITNTKESNLSRQCDLNIHIPHKNELQLFNDNVPTNSCVSFLLFFNIIVSLMANQLSNEDYSINHTNGNIGTILNNK